MKMNEIIDFAKEVIESLEPEERAQILANEGCEIAEIMYPEDWSGGEINKVEFARLITECLFRLAPARSFLCLRQGFPRSKYAVFGDTEDENGAFWDCIEFSYEKMLPSWLVDFSLFCTRVMRLCQQIEEKAPLGFFYVKVPFWAEAAFEDGCEFYYKKMGWKYQGYERLAKSCMADFYGVCNE